MSYKLSKKSYTRLTGVNDNLIKLFELAIKRTPVDFGIDWMGGFRSSTQQNELFKAGNSTKDGYEKSSKHQSGNAVDFIPYISNEIDRSEHNYLIIIGVIFSCANELGLKIRSGANWDNDGMFLTDQNFKDLPHIELL